MDGLRALVVSTNWVRHRYRNVKKKSGGASLRDSIISHYIEVSTNAKPPLHAQDGGGRNAR